MKDQFGLGLITVAFFGEEVLVLFKANCRQIIYQFIVHETVYFGLVTVMNSRVL